jgi:hypothetical protein
VTRGVFWLWLPPSGGAWLSCCRMFQFVGGLVLAGVAPSVQSPARPPRRRTQPPFVERAPSPPRIAAPPDPKRNQRPAHAPPRPWAPASAPQCVHFQQDCTSQGPRHCVCAQLSSVLPHLSQYRAAPAGRASCCSALSGRCPHTASTTAAAAPRALRAGRPCAAAARRRRRRRRRAARRRWGHLGDDGGQRWTRAPQRKAARLQRPARPGAAPPPSALPGP